MATLLLRMVGPMQSWGITSRFGERDSRSEPSKSGVLGLVCAALGRDRAESIEDLAALLMGVRVDVEGALVRDYHTALNVVNAKGGSRDTVLTNRYYLADAAFWVGLEGSETLLTQCNAALRRPVWPIFLGRKSCLPSEPIWSEAGVVAQPLVPALSSCPWLGSGSKPERVRLVVEDSLGSISRSDQPAGPFAERRFTFRRLRQEFVSCT